VGNAHTLSATVKVGAAELNCGGGERIFTRRAAECKMAGRYGLRSYLRADLG